RVWLGVGQASDGQHDQHQPLAEPGAPRLHSSERQARAAHARLHLARARLQSRVGALRYLEPGQICGVHVGTSGSNNGSWRNSWASFLWASRRRERTVSSLAPEMAATVATSSPSRSCKINVARFSRGS